MNGRVYDARLGRFIQADPLVQNPTKVQSLNRYSYVWNNPLNATDPSGFVCEGQACMDTRPEDNKPIERIVVRGTQPDSAMQHHHNAMQQHIRHMVMEGVSQNSMSGTVTGVNEHSEKGFFRQLAENLVSGLEMMASNPFVGIAEAQQELQGAELSGDETAIERAQLALYSTVATVVVVSATPGPATGGKTKVDFKSVGKGMNNPTVKSAAARGKEAHKEFAEKIKQKPGWQSEKTIIGPNGEKLRPDALTPSGRPVELKPNTPSGRRQGTKQIEKYKEATGTNGRVIYYDPKD